MYMYIFSHLHQLILAIHNTAISPFNKCKQHTFNFYKKILSNLLNFQKQQYNIDK